MKPMHIVEAQQVLIFHRDKSDGESYLARAITTLLEYLKLQEEEIRKGRNNVNASREIQWER